MDDEESAKHKKGGEWCGTRFEPSKSTPGFMVTIGEYVEVGSKGSWSTEAASLCSWMSATTTRRQPQSAFEAANHDVIMVITW